jgi:uncharacterized RDD family membrane protein YckC
MWGMTSVNDCAPSDSAILYASWLSRVCALFIDILPLAVFTAAGYGLLFVTRSPVCASDTSALDVGEYCGHGASTLGVFLLAVAWMSAIAYLIWNFGYRQGISGSSLGKSMTRIRVVGEATGRPIGFTRSVVRQLVHVVDLLCCGIGYLLPLLDAKRQTLADKLMSTVCLPNRSSAEPSPDSAR